MSSKHTDALPGHAYPDTLPDFRNLWVMVRILLSVTLALLLVAALRARSLAAIPEQAGALATSVEPVLLVTVVVLYALSGPLLRLPYAWGAACVLAVSLAVTAAIYGLLSGTALASDAGLGWHLACAAITAALLLGYFRLRNRAYSPALSEARLQALQARIRPHFLFNSLTAVLSLMRSEPRRAEAALEDLAELFRSLMADNRALATLGEEVALTRRYLELEHLRLGSRLRVDWHIDPGAEAAAVPPLMLQPLVENAVYHGIEPSAEEGTIRIGAQVRGEQLELSLSNPYHPEHQHRQGNRMALANIDERLRLHFDVEARLDTRVVDGRFEIRVIMPLRKGT